MPSQLTEIPYKNLWEALVHYPAGVVEMLDYIVQDLGEGSFRFRTGADWFDAAKDSLKVELKAYLRHRDLPTSKPKFSLSTYERFVETVSDAGGSIARFFASERLVRECRAIPDNTSNLSPASFLRPIVEAHNQHVAIELSRHIRDRSFPHRAAALFSRLNPLTRNPIRPPVAESFPRATVMRRGEQHYILPISGHFISGPDYGAYSAKVTSPFDPSFLGEKVREALSASRYLGYEVAHPRHANLLFNVDGPKARSAWLRKEKRALDISSQSSFWAPIVSVEIKRKAGEFVLSPDRSEEAMCDDSPSRQSSRFAFPADAADEDIGKIVLAALDQAS